MLYVLIITKTSLVTHKMSAEILLGICKGELKLLCKKKYFKSCIFDIRYDCGTCDNEETVREILV